MWLAAQTSGRLNNRAKCPHLTNSAAVCGQHGGVKAAQSEQLPQVEWDPPPNMHATENKMYNFMRELLGIFLIQSHVLPSLCCPRLALTLEIPEHTRFSENCYKGSRKLSKFLENLLADLISLTSTDNATFRLRAPLTGSSGTNSP